MRTSVEQITPVVAAQLIDEHLTPFIKNDKNSQRRLNQVTVEEYARAMRSGVWILTHQGIAIDDNGLLIDGQHRLHAVIKSGVAVKMQVTRDIPAKTANTLTIDAIDRGSPRCVGQQLQMRHGIKNGNRIAAICRTILLLAGEVYQVTRTKNSVSNCMQVLSCYGEEINHIESIFKPSAVCRSATIPASLAIALKVGDADKIVPFIKQLESGEMLAGGSPALALRNYFMVHVPGKHGGSRVHQELTRATLTATMYADKGEKLKMIKLSNVGFQYFTEPQRTEMGLLLARCGYPVAVK